MSWQDVPFQLSEQFEFEFLSMSIEPPSSLTRYVHAIVFQGCRSQEALEIPEHPLFLWQKRAASNSELTGWTWNSQMWLSTEFFFAHQTRQISDLYYLYRGSRCGSPFTSGLGSSAGAMVRPRAALSSRDT